MYNNFINLPEVKIALISINNTAMEEDISTPYSQEISKQQKSTNSTNTQNQDNITQKNSDYSQADKKNIYSTLELNKNATPLSQDSNTRNRNNFLQNKFSETGNLDYNTNYNNFSTENNQLKSEKISFEKIFFLNKELFLANIKKSISENSLSQFKDFLSQIGYNEKLSLPELNKILKIALWDDKEALNKFSEIPEVKIALQEYENNIQQKTKENSPITNSIVHQKNKFSINDFNIKELKKIFENAFKNYPEIKEKTHQLLEAKEKFFNKSIKNMSFDFSNDYKELDNYSDKFSKNLSTIKNTIENFQKPFSNDIADEINNIIKTIEFTSQIKDSAYFQLPIIINDNQTTAELYVFKNNKKNKNSKSSSAVISLDLAFLGHFEAYINKTDRNILCQFKTENKNIEQLISSKLNELNSLLKKYNYNLLQVSFKPLEENFSILSKEPALENNKQKKSSFGLDITT